MSSISASDRGNQSDDIRRIREEYENKEAENTKKKNKEVRSLSEKQDQELSKVRDAYNDQLQSLRNRQGETLDERDKRHADDISKIREMYVESLRKKNVDEVHDREAMKSTFEGELSKQKGISAEQKENQEHLFRQSMSEKDRLLDDRETRTNESLQKGLEGHTEKLNAKHESEVRNIAEDRDRKISELHRNMDEVKSNLEDRLSAEERAHRADNERRTQTFGAIYRNQDRANSDLLSSRDQMLNETRNQLKQKYGEKIQSETDKMSALRQKYSDDMDSRTGHIVDEAHAEVIKARSDRTLEAITNTRLRDIERSHLQSAYQAREEDLERQKNEIFDKTNEKARERVNTVLSRTEKLVTDANRRNRMSQDIESMRTREAIAATDNVHKDQIQATNNRADQRVRKIMQSTMMEQQNQVRQHDENLDGLRHNYADNLQNQREAQLESVKNIYVRMDQKLRDLEAHLTKKHDDAVEYYESKIDDIQNQSKKEIQKTNQEFEARMSQREKAVKMEEDSLTQKYEQKMAIQDDLHQKDMNRIEKRHQEQMQAVASRAAAAQNRKA